MATVDFLQKALDFTRDAIESDTSGNYKEAYDLYMKGLDSYMLAIKCKLFFVHFHVSPWEISTDAYRKSQKDEKNDKMKGLIKSKCIEYMDRAEQLKDHLNKADKKAETSEPSANGSTKAKYVFISLPFHPAR